jgi:hypothetical protein
MHMLPIVFVLGCLLRYVSMRLVIQGTALTLRTPPPRVHDLGDRRARPLPRKSLIY